MGNCLAKLGVRDDGDDRSSTLFFPGKHDRLGYLERAEAALAAEADESQRTSCSGGGGSDDKPNNTFYVLRKTEDVHSRYHFTEELGRGQVGGGGRGVVVHYTCQGWP
jgi:hypothetical protein